MADSKVDINLLSYYKDLYGGHKIIYVRFLDNDFIFRTLGRKEYKFILQSRSTRMEIEDAICATCCLYPEEYDFETCGFAGLNEYVANLVEELSGFQNIQTILDEYRQMKETTSLEIQCMDLIKAFIPEYTYEEMQEWSWNKLMYMTVRAERVAALKGFDWQIQDQSEDYMNSMAEMSIDNKEFIQKLEEQGIDPMFFFEDELKETFQRNIIDFPLIGGIHWNDEVILDVIRKQIREKNTRAKQEKR